MHKKHKKREKRKTQLVYKLKRVHVQKKIVIDDITRSIDSTYIVTQQTVGTQLSGYFLHL